MRIMPMFTEKYTSKSTLQNYVDVYYYEKAFGLYKEKNVSGHIKVQTYQVLWP